jgi:hypothetical protein
MADSLDERALFCLGGIKILLVDTSVGCPVQAVLLDEAVSRYELGYCSGCTDYATGR